MSPPSEDYTGDEIVVSGISGRFPNSNNVLEFEHNLYNKIDMADDDESRFKNFHPEVPRRMGKIKNLEKFDASFFSILNKHANQMDPQCRILLEHSYEAILDAGISPTELVGSRTGVFIGCCFSDSRDTYLYRIPAKEGWGIFGNANFYLSNRISYALGLCGPSFTVDTACSSSAYALDCAYKYIMSGACDAAIVGGSQLLLNLSSTVEYSRLGILASDGYCRPFDQNASGFSRADTICVVFLQRQKNSKRVYARLIHTNSNNDGFKKEGSSFPSRIMQQKLMEEFFLESKIDPSSVDYIEAHSTGTKLGDPEEVAAIDEVFCRNRNRSNPLQIGSVKSNMGHAEASSGIASIAKILLAFENGKIAPNINVTGQREDIPAFSDGRIRVVTDVEDLQGPLISMNSFGLGGANAHALFKRNLREKVNNSLPNDDLPRLVLWSGRTEDAVKMIFDDLIKRSLDTEYIALLQNSQRFSNSLNVFRGYGIFSQSLEQGKAICNESDVKLFNIEKRPIVWVFTGMGCQWPEMGKDLMRIPQFAETINKCHDILTSRGINLKNIITSNDKSIFDNILNSYVAITSIEIALTEILKSLKFQPDFIVGHSLGELACAYADGCFTLEEVTLAAYSRGKASLESDNIAGGMAAVGMNYREVEKIIPSDIDIACHNSTDSTTISGPIESVKEFVAELSAKNIFAREVACSGIPLHSRYIKQMGMNLRQKLNEIIKYPRKRSPKWLSSSYPESQWNEIESQFSSGEYHTKNLLNPVLFEEVLEMLPKNSLTIEIAPHGLLKSILKRSIKDGVHLSLAQRDNKNGCDFLMSELGKIYQNGIDMDIAKLFPPVQFPVSRKTPMIAPLIKWDHSEDYRVPYFDSFNFYERRNVMINISDKMFEFVQGHIIDGKVLFPGTGWLYLVWETYSFMCAVPQMKMKVVFENVKFLRATSLQKNQEIIVTIVIHRASGRFEIIEGKSAIAQGTIGPAEDIPMSDVSAPDNEGASFMNQPDFYKEMRLRGYYHRGLFRAIEEIRDDGLSGKVKWNNNWTTFSDCLIQFQVLLRDTRMLILPTSIRKMIIDPKLHLQTLETCEDGVIDVEACPYLNIIKSGGIEIHGFEGSLVNRRKPTSDPVLELYQFIAHCNDVELSKIDAAKVFVQIALENNPTKKFTCIEIDSRDEKSPFAGEISIGISDLPSITPEIVHLTSNSIEIENVSVQDVDMSTFTNVHLLIKSNSMNDKDFIDKCKEVVTENGFILSRESSNDLQPSDDLEVIARVQVEGETIYMLQFTKKSKITPQSVVKITSNVSEWLEPLKESIKTGPTLIYSQNEPLSGILGLLNCIRKEPNVDKLYCVFVDDESAPDFDVNNDFYKPQLSLGLHVNVLRAGKWGSYRHLRISSKIEEKPHSDHYFVNCLSKGDLSTLKWIYGPMNLNNLQQEHIKISYASLNFRDIMLATGKINSDDVLSRIEQQCIMGFEFSGLTKDGRRVMGLGPTGALATHYSSENSILWDVPEKWSLMEAATVPLVYYTVYLAFFITSKIERGKSILIHAGSGGVGSAAIQVALSYGLDVFTTVGTDEKREYLLKEFPTLRADQIGNSRDISFERMVHVKTKGRGVDFLLNSLSGDQLQASIRCMARNGTFLEIGKYDIMSKTNIDMGHFAKRINFKAVFFDDMNVQESSQFEIVHKLVTDDIEAGIVKPLKSNVFNANEVEQAFRFMASGKHIGKVLLKIRENPEDSMSYPIAGELRVYCDPEHSIVLVGGLGGFGMELADFLVLRGCRKLVLSSSRGISNGYQTKRIELWRSYGVKVIISTADIKTFKGCEQLINEATAIGPVGGVFNLAVALRDGIFENQTEEMFADSLAVKAVATKYLDEITRKTCKSLKYFVIFSSVSCGRGNAGQSNYGMANSIMERIMEKRVHDGFHGAAIQWGAIGDVGLLSDLQEKNLDMEISGTLPQNIRSCLEVLDDLLNCKSPIVASMVVAEKKFEDGKKGNIIDVVLNIMSIRDKKSLSMDSTFSRLGMDSLMGVEIQQILERDYDVAISSQELRTLTLSQLEKRINNKGESESNFDRILPDDLKFLLTSFGDETTSEHTILKLDSSETKQGTKILIIPGFEGMASDNWHSFAKNLDYPTFLLQFGNAADCEKLEDILDAVAKDVINLFDAGDKFLLIGYSFGSLLTVELARLLESNGISGTVAFIDGSPQFIQRISRKVVPDPTDDKIQKIILLSCIKILKPEEFAEQSAIVLSKTTWEAQLEAFVDFAKTKSHYSENYGRRMLTSLINRVKMSLTADQFTYSVLNKTEITLFKAIDSSVGDLEGDYGLGKYTKLNVNVRSLEVDHYSILSSNNLIEALNLLI